MRHQIVFTPNEWKRLRTLIADNLYNAVNGPSGVRLISRESGQEIVDRQLDYLRGLVSTAFEVAEGRLTE